MSQGSMESGPEPASTMNFHNLKPNAIQPTPAAPAEPPRPPKPANVLVLGLLAHAMTITSLSFAVSTWSEPELVHLVLGFALFFGGLAMWVPGVLALLQGNTFGGTVMCTYGSFWLAFGYFNSMAITTEFAGSEAFKTGAALLYSQWGVLTSVLFIFSLKLNKALMAVFLTLATAFFLLAGGVYDEGVSKASGYALFVAGLAGFYAAIATLFKDEWNMPMPGV
ncbi:unnamed protein product [Pedinophyceae sp. YPF-701]|nr:unnamed protein product [Pedinophyceae sp. YPF-701]